MFSCGIPSSFSVYTFFFFLAGFDRDLVFCCLRGGALTFLEILVWLLGFEPFLDLLFPPLDELDLDRMVLVGAIVRRKNGYV